MIPDFDSRLRERFDAAPVNEMVPDFSADALWSRITERTKKRSALRIVLPWISHAAAVAAGLLLAWIVLPSGDNRPADMLAGLHERASTSAMESLRFESSPKSTQAAPMRRAERHNETAIARASTRAPHTGNNTDIAGDSNRSTEHALALEKSNVASHATIDSEYTTPALTHLPAATTEKNLAKQPTAVVVHLLDVTGESGERLRRPVEALPARRTGFFARMLSRSKVPDLTGTTAADAVVQRTYLSR